MAADTVRAAAACPAVAVVVVVTDDPAAASTLGALGAMVVGDEPDAGLNPALAHGAAVAAASRPACGTAALAADLPALRPAELGRGLAAAAQWPEAFVADAEGSGTTLYAARPGAAFGRVLARGRRLATAAAARPRSCCPMCPAFAVTSIPRRSAGRDHPGSRPRTAELALQLRCSRAR